MRGGKRLKGLREKAAGAGASAGAALPLEAAIDAVRGGSGVKFDETVEVAVRLGIDPKRADQAVRGAVALPAGTGRETRVAVLAAAGPAAEAAREAGADRVGMEDLLADIKAGKLDFDALVSTPENMRHLAPVGKILGPRGLMPNPKTGGVSANPGEAVRKIKAGQANFRADKAGMVSAPVGKASFSAEDLRRNIESFVEALKRAKPSASKGVYLRRMFISTTMGVGVQVDVAPMR